MPCRNSLHRLPFKLSQGGCLSACGSLPVCSSSLAKGSNILTLWVTSQHRTKNQANNSPSLTKWRCSKVCLRFSLSPRSRSLKYIYINGKSWQKNALSSSVPIWVWEGGGCYHKGICTLHCGSSFHPRCLLLFLRVLSLAVKIIRLRGT